MVEKRIHILIVNNQLSLTEQLLHSLSANKEINKSSVYLFHNRTKPILKNKFPKLQINKELFSDKNIGYAKAVNQLVKLLPHKESLVIILNNDVIIPKNFIKKCLDIYSKYPNLVFSPISYEYKARSQIDSAGLIYFRVGFAYAAKNKTKNVDTINGVCICLPKRIINKIINTYGYFFDESFFSYVEDLELLIRIKKLNTTTTIFPHLRIFHIGSHTWGKRSKNILYHVWKNSLLTLLIHWPVNVIWKDFIYLLAGQLYFLVYSISILAPSMALRILLTIIFIDLPTILIKRRKINKLYSLKKTTAILDSMLSNAFIKQIKVRVINKQ